MPSSQPSGLEIQTTSCDPQYSSDAITGSRSLSHRFDFTPANTMGLVEAALFYASCGRPVIPLEPGAKKSLGRWKGQATTDPTTIRSWWKQCPDANIGMPMGNGIHALDLDSKNGQQGWKSYLEAGGNPDIKVPRQITPNEGQHLLFLDERSFKNFTKRGAHGGIDMRSDGGYIAVAPSKVNGIPYRWAPKCTDLSEPLPEKLLRNIEVWHSESPETPTDTVEMPAPSDMTDIEVGMRLAALQEKHRKFLLEGDCPGGDRSAQAFATCMYCFGQGGWSLEDMARIAPETVLARFGAESPHNASDPLGWCWRQTIVKAWEKVQKEKPAFEPIEDEDKGGHIGIEPILKPIGMQETFIDTPKPPPMLIPGLIPCEVFGLVGPGGSSKTTIILWIMIHVILGKPVFGKPIQKPGACLFITAEDEIDTVRYRVARLCHAMRITPAEQQTVASSLYVEDLTGRNVRFVISTQSGNLEISSVPDQLVAVYGWVGIQMAVIDPATFFGAGERFVNDSEALLMQAARRLSKGLGGAAVGLVHHTGKAVAREAIADQYAGRGGSAFADNARGVLVLHTITKEDINVPEDIAPFDIEDRRVSQLTVAKISHEKPPTVPFWLVRRANNPWAFDTYDGVTDLDAVKEQAKLKTDFVHISALREKVEELVDRGEFPSKTFLRDKCEIIVHGRKLSNSRVGALVEMGLSQGIVKLKPVPTGRKSGRAQQYISPGRLPSVS